MGNMNVGEHILSSNIIWGNSNKNAQKGRIQNGRTNTSLQR